MTEADPKPPAVDWDTAARDAVSEDLRMRADDVRAAFHDLAETLFDGEEPTVEEVQEARQALDQAYTVLEDRAALVVDDVEPWGQPVMSRPYGAAREHYRIEECVEEAGSDE